MKSHWVDHKGKRVFIAEYAYFGANSAALKRESDEIIDTLTQEPLNSVLSISNVEGTTATRENLQVLMDILPHTNKVIKKRCVIGVSGVRWTFVDAFNQLTGKAKLQSFRTLEDALDWIVQE